MAFDILRREIGIETARRRFYFGGYGYPLDIVVFEHPGRLGFFDPPTMTLGIAKRLMFGAGDGVIKNIVRHELAHCILYVSGSSGSDHGAEFRSFCRLHGWGREVYGACADLEEENERYVQPSYDRLVLRIKKILSLGSSPNRHEAEAAVVKANELLLRHNLSRQALCDDECEEEAFLKRVLEYPRRNAKLLCIADILETFFVKTVLNFGRKVVYLEVVGSRVDVELAEYTALFLDGELERLWKDYRSSHATLGGVSMKAAFFGGVATGYVGKIRSLQRKNCTDGQLAVVAGGLERKVALVYAKLGSLGLPRSRRDSYAAELGRRAGGDLSIRRALKRSSTAVAKLT